MTTQAVHLRPCCRASHRSASSAWPRLRRFPRPCMPLPVRASRTSILLGAGLQEKRDRGTPSAWHDPCTRVYVPIEQSVTRSCSGASVTRSCSGARARPCSSPREWARARFPFQRNPVPVNAFRLSLNVQSILLDYFWKRAEEDLGQRWLHVRGSQGNHRVVRPAPCEMSD